MEDIDAILEELERIRKSSVLVLVEGQKDKRALSAIGIENVMTLTKPLYAVVEEIAEKAAEVVLLVDLDVEGKKLHGTLARDLQKHRVKVDMRLRDLLFKTPLRHIEGLDTYLTTASQSLNKTKKGN